MNKGYWVVNMTVSDPAVYAEYQAFVRPFLAASEGRFLIRGGAMERVEGDVQPRIIVIEFPSYEHARRVYHSAEYQAGMQPRLQSSTANFAIVEGFEG